MSNLPVRYVAPSSKTKLLVFVKKHGMLGTGALTIGLLLYVVSIVKGVQQEQSSEPLVIRDTVTVTKTKVVRQKVKGEKVNPAPSDKLDKLSAEEFIEKYSPYAVQSWKKYGVPASITLAQGLVESSAGNSKGARVARNFFGIKCFSKHHKWCCVKANDDSNADSFVIFNSPKESFEGHAKFLCKPRYKSLHKFGRNYKSWAYGLKSKGYATDKAYASKLINVIERYKLYQYDK